MKKANNGKQYRPKKQETIGECLQTIDPQVSKKKWKSLLQHGAIRKNGKLIKRIDEIVTAKDTITISSFTSSGKNKNPKLKILYEDHDLIVVDKPAGLLTVSTEKEKQKTMYRMVSDYLKTEDKHLKVFIIHRLDKDTSGIVVFAKNASIKHDFQANWDHLVKQRGYIAVIEGVLEGKGILEDYVSEGTDYNMHISDAKHGKKAILHYRVIDHNQKRSTLEIDLKTGRKNQIRIQFASRNHPICGDKKYHAMTDPFHRLALHAHILEVEHPVTHQRIRITSPIPWKEK